MQPTPESIRSELTRVLNSRPFTTADRSRRFLTYVVEQSLAGNPEVIKELVLGVEVFDRTTDFDPRTDTIVRVEAGKLRKRLEEYYAQEGSNSALRIEIPKGTYVPHFHMEEEAASSPAPAAPAAPIARRKTAFAVAAAAVAVGLLALIPYRWPAKSKEPPSIAVLPFLNLSADPSNEYFADGLAEDLSDALARLGTLRVASRTSAFSFKGKQINIREIGQQLRVAYAVEGSVRKDGGELKISAQLVRTSDGYRQWSNSFETSLEDIFAVQRRIAEAIAAALERRVAESAIRKDHTSNPAAFDLYVRGRHALARNPLLDPAPVETLFRRAIETDPSYALPQAALASLYLQEDILESRPPQEVIPLAKQALDRALTLDPDLPAAHTGMATLLARHNYDWAAADLHLRHALERNANFSDAYNVRAELVLAPQGKWEDALAANRKAIELDPFSPEAQREYPWLLCQARQFASCLQAAREVPEPARAIIETLSFIGLQDWPSALGALRRSPPSPRTSAFTGFCQARMGKFEEARRVLDSLLAMSRSSYVSHANLAILRTALGEQEAAIDELEQARAGQESFLIFLRSQPVFDALRSHPRFRSLLAALRMPVD